MNSIRRNTEKNCFIPENQNSKGCPKIIPVSEPKIGFEDCPINDYSKFPGKLQVIMNLNCCYNTYIFYKLVHS